MHHSESITYFLLLFRSIFLKCNSILLLVVYSSLISGNI